MINSDITINNLNKYIEVLHNQINTLKENSNKNSLVFDKLENDKFQKQDLRNVDLDAQNKILLEEIKKLALEIEILRKDVALINS